MSIFLLVTIVCTASDLEEGIQEIPEVGAPTVVAYDSD